MSELEVVYEQACNYQPQGFTVFSRLHPHLGPASGPEVIPANLSYKGYLFNSYFLVEGCGNSNGLPIP